MLLQFLSENTHLRPDPEGLDMTKLNFNPKLKFNKEILYQFINQSNIEDYIIASIAHEIDSEDAIELETY